MSINKRVDLVSSATSCKFVFHRSCKPQNIVKKLKEGMAMLVGKRIERYILIILQRMISFSLLQKKRKEEEMKEERKKEASTEREREIQEQQQRHQRHQQQQQL